MRFVDCRSLALLFTILLTGLEVFGSRGQPGLQILDEARAFDGYRLYASRYSEQAKLIKPDGTVAHRWSYPQGETWHTVELLPGGTLMVIVQGKMIFELDSASQVLWKVEGSAHHDFERLENGNTLLLMREAYAGEDIELAGKRFDKIIEFAPDGSKVWEWDYLEHRSDLSDLRLSIEPVSASENWPEINSLSVISKESSRGRGSAFKEGNLLVSFRYLNCIAVIEKSSGNIVWSWSSEDLLGPQMVSLLANGNLLVFDSGYDEFGFSRGYSRVIELDPQKKKVVWAYGDEKRFYSRYRGSCQRLPNGNTLIAESDKGRLFEVTEKGQVVWEYQNASRHPVYRVFGYERAKMNSVLGESLR